MEDTPQQSWVWQSEWRCWRTIIKLWRVPIATVLYYFMQAMREFLYKSLSTFECWDSWFRKETYLKILCLPIFGQPKWPTNCNFYFQPLNLNICHKYSTTWPSIVLASPVVKLWVFDKMNGVSLAEKIRISFVSMQWPSFFIFSCNHENFVVAINLKLFYIYF